MDPHWFFPLLAAAFAVVVGVRCLRARRIDPAARTWVTLAVLFAFVSVWLHWAA